MTEPPAPRVLALALDAMEPALVRRMLDAGELPHLAALLEGGTWGRVESPAWVGSGAVWPAFTTGRPAIEHGICSSWAWQPASMSLEPLDVRGVEPFWRALARTGRRVVALDVPFTSAVALPGSIEVTEWGAHDWLNRATEVCPEAARVHVDAVGAHPFADRPLGWWIPQTFRQRRRYAHRTLEGVRQRGDLALRLIAEAAPDVAIIGFSEVHRAGHALWHTLDASRLPADDERRGEPAEWLLEVYRETDRQIGRLLEAMPSATVLAFSLHGMCASAGIPGILEPWLRARGYAAVHPPARSRTASARQALRLAKRAVPLRAKWVAHRVLPPEVARRIQGPPEAVPAYDWAHTSAFALPTDQHGWVRINLAGREAAGSVPPEAYDALCEEIADALRTLRTTSGRTPIADVRRTARDASEAARSLLPDLVVHWDEDAAGERVVMGEAAVDPPLRGGSLSGQHAPDGFFVHRGTAPAELPSSMRAEDLHRLVLTALDDARP